MLYLPYLLQWQLYLVSVETSNMQEKSYDELRERATSDLEKIFQEKRAIAEKVVSNYLEKMTATGEILKITDEEERLLQTFRRFKTSLRKDGLLFKWQTRRAE